MPCYMEQKNVLTLDKLTDAALLTQGLKAAGADVRIYNTEKDGHEIAFTFPGGVKHSFLIERGYTLHYNLADRTYSQAAIIQKLTQAYGGQVVRQTAARFGWRVKEVSPGRFQVAKRRA